jgi:dihydroorotase
MVAHAKLDGLPITSEVTPHHLSFTDARLMDFNPVFKVNPPLRSENDRRGLWKAYFEEVFDAVATDHAPHPKSSKEATLDQASFGMIGLQAAFGAVNAELHRQLSQLEGQTSEPTTLTDQQLLQLIGMFSWRPAKIAQVESQHGGPIIEGRPANIAVIDLGQSWQLGEDQIRSLSSNSPYFVSQLMGKVVFTFVNGKMVVKEGELCH